MGRATVVCCSEIEDPGWRWLETSLADTSVTFEFARCIPRCTVERNAYFNLARLRGCFEAVQLAGRTEAKALVAQGPTLAAWSGLFARKLGLKIPIRRTFLQLHSATTPPETALLWGVSLPLACLAIAKLCVTSIGAALAISQVISHFPEGWGQTKLMCDRLLGRQARILEFK